MNAQVAEIFDLSVAERIQIPKKLAAEINEFNSKITPYSVGICGRTAHISNVTEELEQIRKMFPKAKRFNIQADANNTLDARRKQRLSFQGCSLGSVLREGGFRPRQLYRPPQSAI